MMIGIGSRRRRGFQPGADFLPVDDRHHDVEEDEIEGLPLRALDTLLSPVGRRHLEALRA
jgi:hypothetical protein